VSAIFKLYQVRLLFPLPFEQKEITAVKGIVPTLQNIVATVNLDYGLDLSKTIALHARTRGTRKKNVGHYVVFFD
jgi:hypothetical protein